MDSRFKMNLLRRLTRENLKPMDLLMMILLVIDPDQARGNIYKIKRQLNRM
jgi:hypothetical protein